MLPAQALEISLRDLNELEFNPQVQKHLWECLESQLQFSEEKHLDSNQTTDTLYINGLFVLNSECGLAHNLFSSKAKLDTNSKKFFKKKKTIQ